MDRMRKQQRSIRPSWMLEEIGERRILDCTWSHEEGGKSLEDRGLALSP